uniref:Exported peptidase n=1 Tax=Tetraselmis sp. GSL018 TaxID=582737 RepID=A0A061QXT9_9CHLO|mmetsp:Transcript_20362/g.48506  ORF Transcript_20362/g.48506 Transcript_20362/m.48506 type:complete len:431 (-) Transcript_20362:866-2158(-)|eukprot:CAMPEP_0177607852 /NCGR_PEP_ID=MMETSP0419_2-20121207/18147_1 /TAXON_ID=582737 /ORGANISM="Tetraselmis sp., Strain GSL018" /LENGTH=430 /DNA_ID=CAMNT_0019102479 /DNA_START=24 /DNA_END=1316 /DNA_ORIENTATION=+
MSLSCLFVLNCLFLLATVTLAQRGVFELDSFWPLCGFDTEVSSDTSMPCSPSDCYHQPEKFPPDWSPVLGCPSSRRENIVGGVQSVMDGPIRSAFGPRPLYSAAERYDFHRGIDLACPLGTPVFAIADGYVKAAGDKSGYTDPVIIVRHYRPGYTSCSGKDSYGNYVGCYHAMYLHMRDTSVQPPVVTAGDDVVAGQLLGFSGASSSGFAHLHFEIRDAISEDRFSWYSRYAVNPLAALPYRSSQPIQVSVGSPVLDQDTYTVAVTVETSHRHDIQGIKLQVYDNAGQLVFQPGDAHNEAGYLVKPSSFVFEDWNLQYAHSDSYRFPWSSYQAGGENECPYHEIHLPPASYSPNYHLDQADPEDFKVGLFNGVRVELKQYSYYREGGYYVRISFQALRSSNGISCVKAVVPLADGSSVNSSWGGSNCPQE